MKICILGDSGLLGQALVQYFAQEKETDIFGFSRSPSAQTKHWGPLRGNVAHRQLDLSAQRRLFEEWFESARPDVLINSIALTDLNGCEQDHDLALKLNVDLPQFLSRLSKHYGCYFIHVSSDQVFDGMQSTPYAETDRVHPLNFYGKTKVQSEQKVMEANAGACVIRTNIVGFRDLAGKPFFAEWLCASLAEKRPISLFDDYITSSIHVRLLAERFYSVYQQRFSGIYHIASRDAVSKYDFAIMLARQLNLDTGACQKRSMKGAGLIPQRPPYLALNVQKYEKASGLTLPKISSTIDCLCEDFQQRWGRQVCPRYLL